MPLAADSWLAMSGFVNGACLCCPFSYKVERRLETAVHIKGGENPKRLTWN